MPILTLTTDWGNQDHYLGAFKGELYSRIPGIIPVDISHAIAKYDILEASFLLKNCYRHFPPQTVHFIGLTGYEEARQDYPYVIVKSNDHFFIGHDSGIFTLLLDDQEKEIFRLQIHKRQDRNNIISELIRGMQSIWSGDISSVATPDTKLFEAYFARPTFNADMIGGSIIFIDSFGNAVVNITKKLFEEQRKERNYIIDFRKAQVKVNRIGLAYDEVESGEIAIIFNQDGYLEIAINRGSAEQLLGLKLNDQVKIMFL